MLLSEYENILSGVTQEELFHFKLRILNAVKLPLPFIFIKQGFAFTCYCTKFLKYTHNIPSRAFQEEIGIIWVKQNNVS